MVRVEAGGIGRQLEWMEEGAAKALSKRRHHRCCSLVLVVCEWLQFEYFTENWLVIQRHAARLLVLQLLLLIPIPLLPIHLKHRKRYRLSFSHTSV